jgi:uncharacterized repeat protein (TIGR03803 family)
LFGAAFQGGSGGNGVVFSLTIKGGTYSALYNFTGSTDEGSPLGTMALDATGNLYGTTYSGGAN